jgi:hypothetical protein
VGPRHVGRALGWIAGSIVVAVVLASFGRRATYLGIAGALAATVWLLFWLPRSAHRAFEVARFARAARRYRVIGSLAFTKRQERASLLSRAGCDIALGRFAAAERLLGAVDTAALDASERAAWLNNRACVALDTGGDAAAALVLVEEASGLRPDVPAVQHTRARALLAVGRVDDAIGVLDAMRTGGELTPYLEAERCRELALAWENKGQADYAADYRERARLHAS